LGVHVLGETALEEKEKGKGMEKEGNDNKNGKEGNDVRDGWDGWDGKEQDRTGTGKRNE